MTCHAPVKARGSLVACAYCPGCRSRRSATWAVRLEDERQEHERSCFLTLTIADACVGMEGAPQPFRLDRRDLQLFFKRLRKFISARRVRLKVKYYAVGEYGEKNARAHYHVILFGLDDRDRVAIEACWPWGIVDIGRVESASIRYVTGYVMKAPLGRLRLHAEREKAAPPFSVMSQGLGAVGADARRHTITTQGVIRIGAKAVPPPRFYVGRLDQDGKRAFLLARRARQLEAALSRVAEGREYVVNNKQLRGEVARHDHNARQRPRGVL